MERNVKLVIAYDGTDFHGWQRQPSLRTVQGTIEQAARRVLRHQVEVLGSGRTDAGVHAAGQVANFRTTSQVPIQNMRRAIGSRLPKDVTIVSACEVPMSFDAIKSSRGKLYRYRVHCAEGRPVERQLQRQTYHFWQRLAIEPMRQGARYLMGRQDFRAMATQGSPREHTIRTVTGIHIHRHYDEVRFDVQGRGFLYNQVRNMVGTLIEVGRGHWPPERVAEIMASGDRSQAGPTTPARGLCLQWVRYDLEILRRVENAQVEASGSEATDSI
ncbi:MAG: tRNA pseudouridine(38-40) synthase TruA [Phycisphaerae bacterium]|nr:tRNA pseudouridine(38-40) synthase TruA [Phycisphaerae bacterium]